MYISELKLWNFRKYGADDFDLTNPHLIVPFKSGMNGKHPTPILAV